jgi:hypothetical protein
VAQRRPKHSTGPISALCPRARGLVHRARPHSWRSPGSGRVQCESIMVVGLVLMRRGDSCSGRSVRVRFNSRLRLSRPATDFATFAVSDFGFPISPPTDSLSSSSTLEPVQTGTAIFLHPTCAPHEPCFSASSHCAAVQFPHANHKTDFKTETCEGAPICRPGRKDSRFDRPETKKPRTRLQEIPEQETIEKRIDQQVEDVSRNRTLDSVQVTSRAGYGDDSRLVKSKSSP